MEIRMSVDDDFIQNLQEKIGGSIKATDITRDALTIFNWAVAEAAKGRAVLSCNKDTGEDVHRLVMPSLMKVKEQ